MSNRVTCYWYENKKGGSYKYYAIYRYADRVCKIAFGKIFYAYSGIGEMMDAEGVSLYSSKELTKLQAEREKNGYDLVMIGFLK